MAHPTLSSKRKTKSSYRFFYPLIGLIGIAFIFYASYIKYEKKILSFNQTPPPSEETNQTAAYTNPVSIKIPSIGLGLPISEANIVNGVWQISDNSASHLSTSAKPAAGGNIVIYGHNKKKIFGPLIGRVKKDDLIELTTEDGKKYTYKVSDVFVTTPDNIAVVLPTESEVLTIYTCTGLLDSKRLIIKALPF